MSWFKIILLLSVLGMTWAKCDHPPIEHSLAVPNASLRVARTNAAVMPKWDPASRAAVDDLWRVAGMSTPSR